MEVKMMSLRRRASVVAALACRALVRRCQCGRHLARRCATGGRSHPGLRQRDEFGRSTGLRPAGRRLHGVGSTGRQVASPTFSLPPSGGGGNVSVVLAMDMSQTVQNAALESMQAGGHRVHRLDADRRLRGDRDVQQHERAAKASVVQDFTAIDGGGAGDHGARRRGDDQCTTGSGSNILDAVALSIERTAIALRGAAERPEGDRARQRRARQCVDHDVSTRSSPPPTAPGIPVFTIGVGDLTTTGAGLLNDLAERDRRATTSRPPTTATSPRPTPGDLQPAQQRVPADVHVEHHRLQLAHAVQVDVTGNGSQLGDVPALHRHRHSAASAAR